MGLSCSASCSSRIRNITCASNVSSKLQHGARQTAPMHCLDSMKTPAWTNLTMAGDALIVNCNMASKCEVGFDQQRQDFTRHGEFALADGAPAAI
eukprot:7790174-Pyramimonas_sp.AAC.1